MKKSEKMRRLMAEIGKAKPAKKAKKAKKKKEEKVDADLNKDGKVDEKDAGIAEKVLKKIRKKKD